MKYSTAFVLAAIVVCFSTGFVTVAEDVYPADESIVPENNFQQEEELLDGGLDSFSRGYDKQMSDTKARGKAPGRAYGIGGTVPLTGRELVPRADLFPEVTGDMSDSMSEALMGLCDDKMEDHKRLCKMLADDEVAKNLLDKACGPL